MSSKSRSGAITSTCSATSTTLAIWNFWRKARWSFLEVTNNLDILEKQGYAFAVVNININYRRAACMGEILRIVTSIKSIGARRCVMHQAITLKDTDTAIADADVTFVIVDTQAEKAVRLEGELRTSMERMAG